MENITNNLAEFAVNLKYEDLPKTVVEKVKLIFLDSVGCALGSYVTDRSKIAIEFASESGGNPQASIIGGFKTSCSVAAFVNGELINALDFDVCGPITGHSYPYTAPPCLAIAENTHSSGKELILSLALSHEIGARIGGSLNQHRMLSTDFPYYKKMPRVSYSVSLIGGVVGATRLLNLNVEGITNAIGIAGASCPILAGQKWEDIQGPSIMCKYNAWAGWCSQLATAATIMAEKGFTGDPDIFSGKLNFGVISGSEFFKPEVLTNDIGKTWYILDSALKAYPCCRANHSGIQALQKIILKNEIKISEIKEIKVMGDLFLLEPNRQALEIKNFIDTQFSNSYIFAVAAIYPNFAGPLWQMPILYNRPEIKELAKKIKVEIHPKTHNILKESVKTGVKITSMISRAIIPNTLVKVKTDKGEYIEEVSAPKGTIDNPISEEEILNKFRNNSYFSLVTQVRIEKIIKMLQKLEELEDINYLMDLLRVDN